MNTLSLKLLGASRINPTVYIDGKKIKCKKNKFGALECAYNCAKSEAEVVITRQTELGGKLWLLMNMIFFFISILGILDPPYDKVCVAVDCKFVVQVQGDTSVTVKVGTLGDSGKFATIEGTDGIKEISNYYAFDKKIKRRWRIQAALRVILFIGIVVGLIFLLINK